MSDTFVDEMEAIVEEVAVWAAEEVEQIVNLLAPDGRAFGQQLKSEEEQLEEYRAIRNDVSSWAAWISNKAFEIAGQLQVGGVSKEAVEALNPLAIATAYALDYSKRMEKLLEDRMV